MTDGPDFHPFYPTEADMLAATLRRNDNVPVELNARWHRLANRAFVAVIGVGVILLLNWLAGKYGVGP